MNKILFIIDCDNFSYNNYNNAIKKINKEIPLNIIKTVLFGNFTEKLKQKWLKIINKENNINFDLVEVPILNKKNITDHVIITYTMEALFMDEHLFFIFASDDVDFIPLYQKIKKYNKNVWQVSQNREEFTLTDSYIDRKINLFRDCFENNYLDDHLIKIINEGIRINTNEDGKCFLGNLKYWLDTKKSFNIERTKFKKFSRLIKSLEIYNLEVNKSEITIKIK